jgi:hypothetical protein
MEIRLSYDSSLAGRPDMNTKLVANISAYASLVCVFSFWLGFGLSHMPSLPQLNLSPLHWLGVEALGVVLAIVAALLRSGIWPVSLVVSLAMLFFTMYVVGS